MKFLIIFRQGSYVDRHQHTAEENVLIRTRDKLALAS